MPACTIRTHPTSGIHFDIAWSNLFLPDRPVLYFNAYNLTDQRPELFINREDHPLYRPMTIQNLMACSALPYLLEPIEIDRKIYCERATVDTVNFRDRIDNHPDLDEIWVVRILAKNQIHPPKTLLDAFNNLVMLFASTTSEDSIALFRLAVGLDLAAARRTSADPSPAFFSIVMFVTTT